MDTTLHICVHDGHVRTKQQRFHTTLLTPKDFMYCMAFSAAKREDTLDGVELRKLDNEDSYRVQSHDTLPDGNTIQAELSVVKLPTSGQFAIVVYIRRMPSEASTITRKSIVLGDLPLTARGSIS